MNLHEIDLRKLYKIWKADLGPFQGFFRSTPFVSLQTYDDFVLEDEPKNETSIEYDRKDYSGKFNKKVLDNIIENCNENNFLIIDLPINEILDLALILNNEYLIKPILNINLLFHPFGIIGNNDNINKLINNGFKLKKLNANKFVMLIPYDRYDEKLNTKKLCDKLNNQYGIGEEDLPYVSLLKELNYSKIIVLTQEKVKEDINNYINFISKDIRVEIIRVK